MYWETQVEKWDRIDKERINREGNKEGKKRNINWIRDRMMITWCIIAPVNYSSLQSLLRRECYKQITAVDTSSTIKCFSPRLRVEDAHTYWSSVATRTARRIINHQVAWGCLDRVAESRASALSILQLRWNYCCWNSEIKCHLHRQKWLLLPGNKGVHSSGRHIENYRCACCLYSN